MKCLNLHAVGDLRVDERPIPAPAADEVLVRVRACGVCGSDIGRVFTHGTYHFPTVIGHEFAGEVVRDDSGELAGKRVAIFPLLPCFECDMCASGNYAQCRDYDYYGSRRDGGFSEYLAVKRWNCIELPANVSFAAGAMSEPASVAHHAVSKLEFGDSDRLLVTGAGPIGLMVGFYAKSRGAKEVYYTDIDSHKLDFAESFGFKRHSGEEVTCAVEGTGAQSAISYAIDALAPFGRLVLMGNPSRDVSLTAKVYQTILRKELHLIGTWNSSYSERVNDWKASLAAMSDGSLPAEKLITHRPTLDECVRALEMMRDSNEFYCKVVAEI